MAVVGNNGGNWGRVVTMKFVAIRRDGVVVVINRSGSRPSVV